MVANKSQLKENDGSQAIQLTITRSNSNRELPLSVSIGSKRSVRSRRVDYGNHSGQSNLGDNLDIGG